MDKHALAGTIRKLPGLFFIALAVGILLSACASKKNTAFNRFYQSFTTRYNVYYNGINAYNEAYNQLIEGFRESYAEPIVLDPAAAKAYEEKTRSGGPFDAAIIKGRKAVGLHSIRTKPEAKPNWQQDPKQVAFRAKTEYNPFLHKAWMLVGQSQFYNGDFLEAMATFAYIARIYKTDPFVRDLARLWQTRCYTEMGWLSEGRKILELVPVGSPLRNNKGIYAVTEAERLIAEGRAVEALPFLDAAAKAWKNKQQRARIYYLTGQILGKFNRKTEAYKAYGRALALTPPFELDLAARIRRAEIAGEGRSDKVIGELRGMARKEKYAEVRDRIYLALGNVYMERSDSTKAIEAYQTGIDSSKTKGADFALANIRLGDIYMMRQRYVKAQPCFSAALSALSKRHPDYARVSKLSGDLDALVVFASSVEEQDSLQRLAAMPEAMRNAVIDSAVLAAKKAKKAAEEAEALQKAREDQEAFNEEMDSRNPERNRPGGNLPPGATPQAGGEFYFYNPPLVAQGKVAFGQKWGKRSNDDNWRRRKRELAFNDQMAGEQDSLPGEADNSRDTLGTKSGSNEPGGGNPAAEAPDSISDPLNRAYYLSGIPLTPEAMAQSDKVLADGLYGMGQVFNERMDLFSEAVRSYEALLVRFPVFDRRLDVLYKLYLLAERTKQPESAERYRQMILKEFPNDNLAKSLSNPDYIATLRDMDKEQDALYQETFAAYLRGDAATTHHNFSEAGRRFPASDLLPKFAFLDALAYVTEGNREGFKQALEHLLKAYPSGDVSDLSQQMLGELLKGRSIARGGYTEFKWDLTVGGDSTATDSIHRPFVRTPYGKYRLMIVYPAGSLNRNALVFAVSSFNYSRFTRFTLDAVPSRHGDRELVEIRQLPNEREAWYYIRQAYSPDGYMPKTANRAILFPISEANALLMEKGRSVGEYMKFLSDSIGTPDAAIVLQHWDDMLAEQKKNTGLQNEEHKLPEAPSSDVSREKEPVVQEQTPPELPVEPSAEMPRRTLPADSVRPEKAEADSSDRSSSSSSSEIRLNKPEETISYEEARTLYKTREAREKAEARTAEKLKKEKEKDRRAELRRREKERAERLKAKERERRERIKALEQKRKAAQKERQDRLKAQKKAQREKHDKAADRAKKR